MKLKFRNLHHMRQYLKNTLDLCDEAKTAYVDSCGSAYVADTAKENTECDTGDRLFNCKCEHGWCKCDWVCIGEFDLTGIDWRDTLVSK